MITSSGMTTSQTPHIPRPTTSTKTLIKSSHAAHNIRKENCLLTKRLPPPVSYTLHALPPSPQKIQISTREFTHAITTTTQNTATLQEHVHETPAQCHRKKIDSSHAQIESVQSTRSSPQKTSPSSAARRLSCSLGRTLLPPHHPLKTLHRNGTEIFTEITQNRIQTSLLRKLTTRLKS